MAFNKDEIKNNLTLEQIESLLADLGGDPRRQGEIIISRTICHGGESHKLYYYSNTHLFRCFTECDSTFDIFELIIKIKKQDKQEWSLYNAISYIINYFSLSLEEDFLSSQHSLQDWKILSKYEATNQKKDDKKRVELKKYDGSFLKNFPRPRILNWEREGITKAVCDARNICYDPSAQGIVIPHYDINNDLVGIRERTLIKENEIYGKYRPAIINRVMYNHPLGFNLYNLNYSKDNIRNAQTAIVYEGEKSCLQFASFFGIENDISVACCGSNLINYQFQLLYNLGIKELVIAFDRQYHEANSNDAEWVGWTKKLYNLHDKYGKYCQISFIFDKEHLLNYKDSPMDQGQDVFLYLYQNRIVI